MLRIQNDLVHAVPDPAVQVILDPPDPDPTLQQDKVRKSKIFVCIIGSQQDFKSNFKIFLRNVYVMKDGFEGFRVHIFLN